MWQFRRHRLVSRPYQKSRHQKLPMMAKVKRCLTSRSTRVLPASRGVAVTHRSCQNSSDWVFLPYNSSTNPPEVSISCKSLQKSTNLHPKNCDVLHNKCWNMLENHGKSLGPNSPIQPSTAAAPGPLCASTLLRGRAALPAHAGDSAGATGEKKTWKKAWNKICLLWDLIGYSWLFKYIIF